MENKITGRYLTMFRQMRDWCNGNIDTLSDEELAQEVVPGKNHGVWLLGHLVVCEDDLSLYLGKGDVLFPKSRDLFSQGMKVIPVSECPPASELRRQWKEVCIKNEKIYTELRDEELDEPHCQIEGDIKDDYFKTKGNVVNMWILHTMYHCGQLGLLVSKCGKSKF
jgi:uncharacterized damage-inducible protein DinB